MGNLFAKTKKCECQCSSDKSHNDCNTEGEQFNEKINTQLLLEINELKKQNECLKALANSHIQKKLQMNNMGGTLGGTKDETEATNKINITKHISMEAIEQYVEGMIADSDVNITYLPDFVERQLYKNILKMVLGLLDNILSNSHITIFNHEINFELVPLKNDVIEGKNDENGEKPNNN